MRNQPATDYDFYFRTLERIERMMLVLGVAALLTAWAYFGWRIAIGFLVGVAIAYMNFHWLKKIVAGVADLTLGADSPVSGRTGVLRFPLRYFFVALGGVVILTVSRESLYGLFAGLFLPVTAMLCEAAYETYRVVSGR